MNREEFGTHIDEIEKIIDFTFNNKKLLIQAFTRKSYAEEHKECKHNEILEYFGDRLLSAILNIQFINDFCEDNNCLNSRLNESEYTNLYNYWSDNLMLSTRISEMKLNNYMIMNSGDEENKINFNAKPQSDLFEAIVAAMYFDRNKSITEISSKVLKLLKYNNDVINAKKDIVSRVKEYCDKNKKYKFTACGLIATITKNGEKLFSSTCKSQKEAKLEVATQFMEYLKQ